MSRRRWVLSLGIVAGLVLLMGVGPEIPGSVLAGPLDSPPEAGDTTIPYAGRLTDDAGRPAEGRHDFVFALYDLPAGGELLWRETQTAVPVRDGNFAVLLGSVEGLPQTVAGRKALWLAVAVREHDAEAFTTLAPRQPVSVASVASTQATALSCAHTHLGENWIGADINAGLIVDNRAGTGDGIRGYASNAAFDYAGLYGVNLAEGPGVFGRSYGGGPGVSGFGINRGVYGHGADGVVGESDTDTKSGVYGVNNAPTGYGVTGRSGGYFGVYAWGNEDSAFDQKGDLLLAGGFGEIFVYGDLLNLFSNAHVVVDLDDDNNTGGAFFRVLDGNDAILWTVSEATGVVAAGTQATVVSTQDHGDRLLYSVEGTGVWVEESGSAALAGGEAKVAFDPVFAQTVALHRPYRVLVTPISQEPVWLYVTTKTAEGFVVRGVDLDGEPADCAFDYLVIAERLGHEAVHMQSTTLMAEEGVK